MRSALICLFFAFIVREGSRANNDFRPTPIPLNEWHEVRDFRSYETAGTLQEAAQTLAPASVVAAIPAHYWEDALRHSVYLTLVRDKIDELIAKGDVIAPDSKPDANASSEVDDHDLWEKIKTAPFDRIDSEDSVMQGDVTIMAKGRLMEENGHFRFTEDDIDKDNCLDDKCKKGIKAIWSVKRVRQREVETSPGKYHYELTFSVVSQMPKEKRKPHANPVRTFTVRESMPERVIDMPQENRKIVHTKHRPQRVVWFHRNISPFPSYNEGRQHKNGLERLFSSLFSDEDDDYVPPRYRKVPMPTYGHHGPPQGQPPYSPYSKVGYVGSPSDQQKRLTYPYKHNSYKYSRPIPPPPYAYGPKPHYLETESIGASYSNTHVTPPEHVYSQSGKHVLTTKPAVLPTPVASGNNTNEIDKNTPEAIESATRVADIVTGRPINRPRPGPIKINYLPDHVRPPVYNAPPGVFVSMDKKPFKPMPPLKLKMKGSYKGSRPIDFRPSPQVLDMQQFSEPDPFKETAFRPITWNYQDTSSTTENTEYTEKNTTTSATVLSPAQKINSKGKKPPKKHENIKSQLTTSTPDIITGNANFEDEPADIGWANLINVFSKTTPMASQKEKSENTESSTPDTSSTTETSTITRRRTSTTTEAEEVEEETTSTTTSTTVKPRKRTRPPPNFSKPDKIKKLKRITTTTTTTTTQAPLKDKTTQDLTPQASSAAATKPTRSTTERTTTITTTTTSKPTTTTTTKTTTKPTTTERVRTTEEIDLSLSTTQPKLKNRFRQSTLLHKGTSVNHDKWSSLGISTKSPSTLPSVFPPRRKGSNFQGHVTQSTKLNDRKHNLHHDDKTIPLNVQPLSTAGPHYEEQVSRDSFTLENKKDKLDEDDDTDQDNDAEDDEDEDKDNDEHKEFIFSHSASATRSDESSENNEILESDSFTTEEITTTQVAQKNLTKCQKKKLLNSSATDQPIVISLNVDESNNSTDTKAISEDKTSPSSSSGILDELIQSFTGDDTPSAKNPRLADFDQQESESQSHFVKLDDDLQDFLDSLDKGRKQTNDDDYEEDDVDTSLLLDEDDESPIDKWEHKAVRQRHAGHADADDDYRDRPYGLLELLAMD